VSAGKIHSIDEFQFESRIQMQHDDKKNFISPSASKFGVLPCSSVCSMHDTRVLHLLHWMFQEIKALESPAWTLWSTGAGHDWISVSKFSLGRIPQSSLALKLTCRPRCANQGSARVLRLVVDSADARGTSESSTSIRRARKNGYPVRSICKILYRCVLLEMKHVDDGE
jgi:hypothetical protein